MYVCDAGSDIYFYYDNYEDADYILLYFYITLHLLFLNLTY